MYSAEDRGGLQEMEVVGLPGGGVRRGVVKKLKFLPLHCALHRGVLRTVDYPECTIAQTASETKYLVSFRHSGCRD